MHWSYVFLALNHRYLDLSAVVPFLCTLQDISIWSVIYFMSHSSHNGVNIDGLVQEICNSSALAMELRLFCTNPSIWSLLVARHLFGARASATTMMTTPGTSYQEKIKGRTTWLHEGNKYSKNSKWGSYHVQHFPGGLMRFNPVEFSF